MARKLRIKLEATGGAIDKFQATVGNNIVISTNGTATPIWSGTVADAHVALKVQAIGMQGGTFRISIDLENVMSNQALELSLVGGYSELQMVF